MLQGGGGLALELNETDGRRIARAEFRFRLGDKRIDMRLGTWPSKGLAELRDLRDRARVQVKQGRDPRAVAREEKAEAERQRAEAAAEKARAAARLTVRGIFERWDALHLRRAFKDQGAKVRRYFAKDVLPTLGDVPIEELNRARVAALVDGALERDAPRSAQMLLGYLRQFCRWSLARGYLDTDPTAALAKSSIKTNGPRERVLSASEVRELARLLPQAGLPSWAPPAVWLLLATAARVGELLQARWEDFDLEAREWTIPAERAKNGRAHVVDLSDFALERLAELRALRSSPWLVAGRTPAKDGAPAKPVNEKGLSKLLKDRQRPEGYEPLKNRKAAGLRALVLPGGAWTPHDLRRTAATLMQGLGVTPAVIEKALNHSEPRRLVAIYQRFDYRGERRDAFNHLGNHLERLAKGEGTCVVALRRAGGRDEQ